MTTDALTPFRWLQPPYGDRGDLLGEIYCVTLLRGLDPAGVLRRFGARTSTEMSFAELGPAVSDFTVATGGGDGGGYVAVVATGGGCAAVEPMGWSGTDDPTLARLWAGTDVVSVLRHDYAWDQHGVPVGVLDDDPADVALVDHFFDLRTGAAK
jgi:hypothetical protein